MIQARRLDAAWRHERRLLEEDLRRVAGLRQVRERAEWIDELVEDLDRQFDRSSSAIVVTLVGATGAGKSTLLNAIAGADIAREGVDRPTTSRPTIYAPVDAAIEPLRLAGAQVETYEPETAGGGYVLVDAPDMNSIAADHAVVARALLQRSDLLLVVLHRQSIVEAAPVELIDAFARRRALAFVLNRTDELTPDAVSALTEQIRTLARDRWQAPEAPILAMSARRARTEAHGVDRRNVRELLARLAGSASAAQLRRHNSLGSVAAIADVMREVREAARSDQEAVGASLGEALDDVVQRVEDDCGARMRLQRIEIAERLRIEVARRWDGPIGWSLRWATQDLLGAGAAGWIARRNPLLAAGTLAGTVVAASVRDAAGRRPGGDGPAVLPGGDELSRWYRQATAPVRVRLGRLYVDEPSWPLPDEAAVVDALGAAVERGWRRLAERDLPAIAEHGWLRYLRLPLDLPMYGLLAWVVYLAARGFLEQRYVGMDFLANAALLGGVYVLAARTGVVRILGWRTRRLLRGAASLARAEIEVWRDEVESATEMRVRREIEALDRIILLPRRWQAMVAVRPRRQGGA